MFKRITEFACRSRFNRFAILFYASALILATTERWVLPANLVQFNWPDARVSLNGQQCIRSLDRSMLAGVTGKNDSRISLAGQAKDFQRNCSGCLCSLRQEGAAIEGVAEIFEDGQAVFAQG